MFKLPYNCTHFTCLVKVMFKILQPYMNWELMDVQAGFRKGRGTRDQIVNTQWITEKAVESQQNIYLCFTDYAKAFDCVDHNKPLKILKEMVITDHLTCLLKNLYVGQEATVRTSHGTTDWFKIGIGGWQGCTLSPRLFNFYAENTMWNAGLNESQTGITIAGRNFNNLRYAADPTLTAESEEELKSFSMRMKKQSEKAGLKSNIQRTKIMASGPISSWQTEGEKVEGVDRFYFLGLQNHCGRWLEPQNQKTLAPWKRRSSVSMTNLDSILESRDIILLTKVHIVSAMVFPVVMYGCEVGL